MNNEHRNSDWCSFFNSGEDVNGIGIEDVALECWNHETESVQDDQLRSKD